MAFPTPSSSSDIVFVDTLRVAATIGPDCWGKTRPQPLEISIHLHLQPNFLNKSGATDDVLDSVHYGHLTKVVSKLIESKSEAGFPGIDGLVAEVAREAFKLAGESADAVRVVVGAPKLVLLAENFTVDTTVSRSGQSTRTVSVTNLSLPVLIGVNPPERLAKQRVVTDIVVRERATISHVEYISMMDKIIKGIEASDYLTLEKFVLEIVRTACLASSSIESVTARAQKPSALSFARFSGVEITRRRSDFVQ